MTSRSSTNCVKMVELRKRIELKYCMLEQPVNSNGCSSIQLILREFYLIF